MRFIIYQDTKGEWRWSLKAKNGRVISDCGEGYRSRRACVAMCSRINPAIPRRNAA